MSKRKNITIGLITLGALVGISNCGNDGTPVAPAPTTSTRTATTTASAEQVFRAEVGDVELTRLDTTTNEVTIGFKVKDNLTTGMRASGARSDTFAIAKAARKVYPGRTLIVTGTALLVDKGGNEKDGRVLLATYTPADLDAINFDTRVAVKNIWNLSQPNRFVHRALLND